MKRLYDLASGKPLIAKASASIAEENTNVTVITAVANKTIIPVWSFIYALGDDTSQTSTILLSKGAKFYIRQHEMNPAIDSFMFRRYDFVDHGADMGTGSVVFKSVLIGAYAFHVLIGYYLLDV